MFQVSPETIALYHAWQEENAKQQVLARLQQLKFAAILCTCSRRYNPNVVSAPDECMVHFGLMWDPFSEKWMY